MRRTSVLLQPQRANNTLVVSALRISSLGLEDFTYFRLWVGALFALGSRFVLSENSESQSN